MRLYCVWIDVRLSRRRWTVIMNNCRLFHFFFLRCLGTNRWISGGEPENTTRFFLSTQSVRFSPFFRHAYLISHSGFLKSTRVFYYYYSLWALPSAFKFRQQSARLFSAVFLAFVRVLHSHSFSYNITVHLPPKLKGKRFPRLRLISSSSLVCHLGRPASPEQQ